MGQLKENALAYFELLNKNKPLGELRTDAIKRFEAIDFPTTKNEEWKYTNLKKIVETDFQTLNAPQADTENDNDLLSQEDAILFVFKNGNFVFADSIMQALPDGVVVKTLAQAQAENATLIAKHFAQYADYQKDSLTALNTALATDGVFVYVPNGIVLETSIFIRFEADAQAGNVLIQPRNLFIIEKNASATIVEHFVSSQTANQSFTNSVTEIFVAENANLDHYKIQTENAQSSHVGTTQAFMLRDAYFSNTTVSLSGALVRNNLNIGINGENCEAYMNGLTVLNGKTHTDHHTAVDHIKPHSQSNELYKGIFDDKSTGVFNGKIFVRQDAQKTNAYQSNRNILLSENATVDTKPQLEIWADDVKCSHGCTVGALDEEPMFYLRSRGIPEANAKALLMFAFVGEVLDRIKVSNIRTFVEKTIAQRLNIVLE